MENRVNQIDAKSINSVVQKRATIKEFGRLKPICVVCGKPIGPEDFATYRVDRKGHITSVRVAHKAINGRDCDDSAAFPYSRQADQVFNFPNVRP